MVARMTTYRFRVDAHELARKAESGLLPIFEGSPASVPTDCSRTAATFSVVRGGWGLPR